MGKNAFADHMFWKWKLALKVALSRMLPLKDHSESERTPFCGTSFLLNSVTVTPQVSFLLIYACPINALSNVDINIKTAKYAKN